MQISTTYQQTIEKSRQFGERRDCAVVAVSIVCGLEEDYEGVHTLFRAKGRRTCKGTNLLIIKNVVDWLGFTMEEVPNHFGCKTVRTLGREMKYRSGSFLVLVRGHILAVRDGQVHDWTNNKCNRIIKMWRIREKPETKIDIVE